MNDLHIYSPASVTGRTVRHCTTCRCRRRFLVRMYRRYEAVATCGGCGYVFAGKGREAAGAKRRRTARAMVKGKWPKVPNLRIASVQLFTEDSNEPA